MCTVRIYCASAFSVSMCVYDESHGIDTARNPAIVGMNDLSRIDYISLHCDYMVLVPRYKINCHCHQTSTLSVALPYCYSIYIVHCTRASTGYFRGQSSCCRGERLSC